jgi:hypothetical protein
MPKKSTKRQKARSKPKVVATKPETGAVPKDSEAKRGQTGFLLRLTPDVRAELESLKSEARSKSLQGLILQLLAEGLARKADFKASELFARDLHIASLAATVGSTPDLIIGNRRVEMVGNAGNNFVIDQAALLEAHQRVIVELENQKLTSFASIMDPALLSYRLLIDYASQDSASRDPNGLIRDFSNGLMLSALQAMDRGKWGFAESLLLQAAASDPSNVAVSNEAGIYLLRRLVRRWCRPYGSLTPGVSIPPIPPDADDTTWSGVTIFRNKEGSRLAERIRPAPEWSKAEVDNVVDETAWATALKAWNLLVNDGESEVVSGGPEVVSDGQWYWRWRRSNISELKRGNGRVEVWKRLATIIVCTSSPDPDDLKLLEGSAAITPYLAESTLIGELVKLFKYWERSFRMTREVSRLQREWSEWLEPLEVLWWLGYRKEAHDLAREARGFVAEKTVMDRWALIRDWNPAHETVDMVEIWDGKDFQPGGPRLTNLVDQDGFPEELDYPTTLLNRPMNI